MATFLQLPEELLLLTLARVDLQALCNLSATSKYLNKFIKEPELWKRLAECKWGPRVLTLRAVRTTDWPAFCRKRTCLRTIRRSPLQLGQEVYRDPWEHLVCCLLCRYQLSMSAHIETHSALQPDVGQRGHPPGRCSLPGSIPDAVRAAGRAARGGQGLIVRPLGLADTRYKAVAGMSRAFLAEDWDDVQEFYGCGKFVSDSWRIFCCGQLQLQGVEDVNLRRYLRWANGGGIEDQTSRAARKRAAPTKLPAAGTLRSGAKRKAAPAPTPRRSQRGKGDSAD